MAKMFSKNDYFQCQLIVLCGILCMLLIPFIFVRAFAIMLLGMLIYTHERQLKMLVPASPGFLFWFGNVLSYIVGGFGFAILADAWDDFGIRYLNDALFYLGIGLSCYVVGMWLGGVLKKQNTPINVFMDLKFSHVSIISISSVFLLTVLLGGTGDSEMDVKSSYYNIVIGSFQSIENIPLILLSIYLLQKHPKWWLVGILFCSKFVIAISGMSVGYGRNKLIFALLSISLTWLALHYWYGIKISNSAKLIILCLPFVVIIYFGIASTYRHSVKFDAYSSISERQEFLRESINSASSSNNFVIDSLTQFCERLVQAHGLELLGMAETGYIEYYGWTMNDLEQAIFVYIPKIWYKNKGNGLGSDIMVYYGFTEYNHVPPTILADSFRRSGLFGVVIVYFVLGFVATTITIYFNNHWGSFGPLLALYVALSSTYFLSFDVMDIYTFYVYRIVSSGLVIYVLLRITGFLPKGTLRKSC
ncbi:hypothetical protein [Methylococcus mesophilus]|uniref:hypothetical protein n=1 Tax=Methylococcus mesophilus TaxID=2993564 RepID=UPI00224B09D7|nr:hypothetical protein [Methylococcus mesophilus]UZR28735.1 hypothetical protein OOT43_18810 [Methylococcus mesophilus]